MEVDEASDKTLVASSEVGSENGGVLEVGAGVEGDMGDGAKKVSDSDASGEVGSENGGILEGEIGVKGDMGEGVKRGLDIVASGEVGSGNDVILEGGVGIKDDNGDGAKRGFDIVASGEVGSGNVLILEGGVGGKDDKGDGVQRGSDVVTSSEAGSGNGVILEGGVGIKDDNGDGAKRGFDIVASGEVGSGNGVILEGGVGGKDDKGDGVQRGSDVVTSGEVGSGNGVILDGGVGVKDDKGDGVQSGSDVVASGEVGSGNGVILEGDLGVKEDISDGVQRGSDIVASSEVGNGNAVNLESEIGVKDDGVGRVSDLSGEDEEMKSGVGRVSDLGGDGKEMKSGLGNDSGLQVLKGTVAKQKGEVNGVESDESDYGDYDDDGDDTDIGDQSYEYRVGDFVWGKIKSYPWWPGQIYGESDASEYALKLKQKDRFLVAYFGDGSFSWCGPSQLKPFVENFKVMSEQSNSKNFTYAVEAALDEFSKVVERDMACSCLAEKNGKLEASMASNSGLKVGVLVPAGVGKSFIAQYNPKKLIDSLRNYAETASMKNLLELTVIKSWLTVYGRAKGGYPLPLYHYPRGIEGLEDKSGNPVKVSAQGPNGDEWLSIPVEAADSGLDLSNQFLLSKCQEASGDIQYQRRKQKSVAELIEDEMRKEEDFVNESVSNVVSSGKRGRRQKAVASRSPRTVGEKITAHESKVFGEKEADEPPPSGTLQSKILSGGESEGDEETAKSNRLRERKRSKYLSPPFTNPSQIMKISSFKRDSQTESVKNSRVGERMARVAGQLIGLQSPSQTEFPIVSSKNNAKSGSSSPETALQDDRKTNISMHLTASPVQLLSQLQSAAADPSCLIEKSEVDSITENIISFRNKVQQKGEPGSMKRKPECVFQTIENGIDGQDFKMPPAKRAASGCETMTNVEDASKETPVTLILTFPPAYPLPSRNELIKIYGKFGPVDNSETGVWYNSFSARVSYLRRSDAEEAYKASVEKNPFGDANVNYRLRERSSLDNGKATQSCDDEATQLGLIREKLKMVTSIVETCGGKISVEFKSDLESEVETLLERVRSMPVTLS
ncbi:hypothetical protein ACET3Z_003946 [Daucus carota]